MTSVAVQEVETEARRVERWRLHTLIDAGYPVAIADRLACNTSVDLHQAVELVRPSPSSGRRPCTPELAAEILL